MNDLPCRWLAILVGRLGLTLPEAEVEFFGVVNQIWSGRMNPGQLDSQIKDVVQKYTGDPETLMYDPNSPTYHCKTWVKCAVYLVHAD